MSEVVYSTAQIKEVCAEMRWSLDKDTEGGRLNRGMIRRFIVHDDILTEVVWKQVKAFLQAYTSAINYVPTEAVPTPPACATVAAPFVEGKPQTGTWHGGPIDIEQDPQTKRWRLTQTLFRAASATETEFVAEDGCRFKVYRKFYVDQVTVPAFSPAKSSGVDWTGSSFTLDPETGFYNGWTERREQLYQTIAEFMAAQDTFEGTYLEKHIGVRTGDLTESGAAVTIPLPSAATDGMLVEVDRQKNANCTQDVTVRSQVAISVPSAEVVEADDAFETRLENQDNNALAAGTTPAAEVGRIKVTQSLRQRFKNRWNMRTIVRTAKIGVAALRAYIYGVFETSEESLDRNNAAQLTPPVVADGTAVQDQSTLNEFALWDNRRKIDTAVNVKDAVKQDEEDAFELRAEVEDANESGEGTVPVSQTAGIITRVISAKQRFQARWNVRTITRTAKAIASAAAGAWYSVFETSAESVAKHQAAALSAPEVADGTAVQDQSTLNEFALWDNRRKIDTAVNVKNAEVVEEKTAFETRNEVEDSNESAAGTPPATQTEGTIVQVISRKTRFLNRWVVRTVTRACNAITAAVKEYREDLFSSSAALTDRNQAAAGTLGAWEAGKNKRVTAEENAFAKWDNRSEEETAKAVAQDPYTSRKTEYTDETTTRKWNQASVPNAALGEQVDGRLNRFGKNDLVITAETPVSGILATTHTWYLLGASYHVDVISTEWVAERTQSGRYCYDWVSTRAVFQVKEVFTMKFHTTEALAIAEISGGKPGSAHAQLAPGLWRSVKVTRDDVSLANYNYPNPYAPNA